MRDLHEIATRFRIDGEFSSSARIGSGHINDSFLVMTKTGVGYVLQRINHNVFRDIEGLMHNIRVVTSHLSSKIIDRDPAAAGLVAMNLVPTNDGNWFLRDPEGNYWRMYNHIRCTKSYDTVISAPHAFEGGKAFAVFQRLTADIRMDELAATIPFFHDIGKRLDTFRSTAKKDPAGRVKDVAGEIAFVEKRAEEMKRIQKLGEAGKFPVRVTHNDTKFNNILFNEQEKAVCIVDLDTVMPGYVLYDFGDAIRTGASTADEDEKDLSKMKIDLELFEAYSKGYLSVASGFLNDTEKENLAFSARFMTFIIGLRFLTDHIDGDHYFRIHFEGHNLQRARAQFRLVESMEECAGEMEEIIRRHCRAFHSSSNLAKK
jgi:hypothetical protein